jgi:phosphate uptake regulator
MEVRRIQLTGTSTYIVSLPKKWVEKSKLNKGDPVQIIEQDDSTLTLRPRESAAKKNQKQLGQLYLPVILQTRSSELAVLLCHRHNIIRIAG